MIHRCRNIIISYLFFSLFFCGIGLCQTESAATDSSYLSEQLAREEDDGGRLTDIKLPNIFEVVIRFMFALLILIGCIFAITFCYKKFFSGNFSMHQTEAIRVLEHRFLDAKRSIYLIDIAGKILVVGSGGENLNLIAEITHEEHIANLQNILNLKAESYKATDFKRVLSGVAASEKAGEKEEAQNSSQSDMLSTGVQSIRSKINKIKRIINEK